MHGPLIPKPGSSRNWHRLHHHHTSWATHHPLKMMTRIHPLTLVFTVIQLSAFRKLSSSSIYTTSTPHHITLLSFFFQFQKSLQLNNISFLNLLTSFSFIEMGSFFIWWELDITMAPCTTIRSMTPCATWHCYLTPTPTNGVTSHLEAKTSHSRLSMATLLLVSIK